MPRAVVGCELVENWDKLREKQIQMHCCLFLKLQQRVESALTNSSDGGARLPVQQLVPAHRHFHRHAVCTWGLPL